MPPEISELFAVQFKAAPTAAVREHGFRLDAGFHASNATEVLESFATGQADTKKISEIAHTFGLSDFGLLRIPADRAYGVPFFTVSDIQEQDPSPTMFLSREYEPNLRDYLVSKGTVLVSRSGSVGNVILVGENLSGKAVANHAIRVIAKSPEWSSLIYAALSGTLGKSLLKDFRYGSVIDQIKSFQINSIRIPIPPDSILRSIHSCIAGASKRRDDALQLLTKAKCLVLAHNQLPDLDQMPTSTFDPERLVEAVAVPVANIVEDGKSSEFRLEENFYNPIASTAIQHIEASRSNKKCIRVLAKKVIMGARFKRTYVESSYGTPFLSGRSIVQTRPTDLKHLSNSQTEDMKEMLVERNWILLTCSGTIGRTCFVWNNFEGYAASQHILRIVPDENEVDPAYLYAFLSSEYGYEQIIRFRHGSVIDELTDEQLKKVIVPIPSTSAQSEIAALVRRAYELRAEAIRLEDKAQKLLMSKLRPEGTDSEDLDNV